MINIDALNDDEKLAALESIHKSIAESKEIQKKKITTNVELIVKALKKIESDLKQRYDETGQLIANLKNGEDGRDGKDGKDGKNGRDGRDGPMGPRGYDGLPGRNGIDGADGVSITDAHIDFDGSLIISLSSGRVINVGEVVAADIAEKIKVITNGGGTSQGVLDAIASLQAQIDSIASGLVYQGTWNASTNNPALASGVGTAGYYYIVAVAGSTNLNGVTDWQVGDWALFNGTVWQKLDQTNLVTSVAGRTGAVTLTTADIGGLGTIATQAANNVSITGGSITGITDLAIADGGTGASTAAAAITALTGTQTAGRYLRSDGTNAALAAIVAADVPTLNQNTTGTAAGLSATLATTSGGTGLTSFTANGVVYASSTSALATGSALTFDGSSLGMGNPTVYGTRSLNSYTGTTASAIGFSQQISGFANTFLGSNNSGSSVLGMATGTFGQSTSNSIPWTVSAYGSEQMRLTSTGLGIGTSSPAAKLDVTANAVVMGYFRSSGGSANDQRLTFTSGGGRIVLDAATNSTGASSAFAFTLGGTEGMRLTTTGLGIGTSSPTRKLDIYDATAPTFALHNATSGTGSTDGFLLFTLGADTTLSNYENGYMAFSTNATERMRLSAAGGLSIGTTTDAGAGGLNITGNAVLGDASTDTVTVNGYMGVGGAGASSRSIAITSTALIGTSQFGIVNTPTFNSQATSAAYSYFARVQTEAAAFTLPFAAAYIASTPTKGAGSTITALHGLYIDDQTQGTNNYGITSLVSSGTNKWNIYASGTAQNYFAGNVGIGVTTASEKLQVQGGVLINGTSSSINYTGLVLDYNTSTGEARVAAGGQSGASAFLTFTTTSGGTEAERMRLDSAGILGLGVTPSAWSTAQRAIQLASNGSVAGSATYPISLSSNAVATSNGWAANYIADGFATLYAHSAGQHRWFTAPSGTAGTAISFTQAMTLDASGNLGIGATSMGTTRLVIRGDATTNFAVAKWSHSSNASSGFDIGYASSVASNDVSIWNYENGFIRFATNNTERARINATGDLLLGTTSNSPAGTVSQFVNSWSGGAKWGISLNQTVSSSTQYTHINFSTNGTTVGYINANNSVTTYNSVSDYRLKNVIGAISGSGERIDALEPIEYEWKTDGSRTRGFLAHKFQEVYANSVSGTKDAVDEQGNPIYQAMQAGSAEVIADLVAEIQSLRKRLADAGI